MATPHHDPRKGLSELERKQIAQRCRTITELIADTSACLERLEHELGPDPEIRVLKQYNTALGNRFMSWTLRKSLHLQREEP